MAEVEVDLRAYSPTFWISRGHYVSAGPRTHPRSLESVLLPLVRQSLARRPLQRRVDQTDPGCVMSMPGGLSSPKQRTRGAQIRWTLDIHGLCNEIFRFAGRILTKSLRRPYGERTDFFPCPRADRPSIGSSRLTSRLETKRSGYRQYPRK